MNWEEEVDKVAGVETPIVTESLFKPKTRMDKKFLTVEEGGTMRTDIPVFVDKSLLKNVPLDTKGKQKVKEANNEMAWMTAVDKAFKEKASVKKEDSNWEKVVDKGLEVFNMIPSTVRGVEEAAAGYLGGMAGAVVSGGYSVGKTLLEHFGKIIADNVAARGDKNYKPQEVDWEANRVEGERLGQKVAKIPFGIFSSGEPETPLGKHLLTPPPLTSGSILHKLSQSLDPRRLVMAPAEAGKEAMDLVNESWGVPKDSFLRHADTTAAEFAGYIIAGKAYKNIRQVAAEAFHKNAWDDLTPDQKQLVTVSLEDLISRGYSEAEVLRNWGNPELFAQSLARRNRGEEAGVETPKRPPIVPAQEMPSTTPERALPPPDRRPVAVSEPFKPGETPDPYTHKSDEVAPTGSAQAPKVTPDSPAKFMVREELKKKLADGSIKFPPRMESTVKATTSAEGDIDESGWMDLVDEAAGIKKEATIPAVFKTMHIDDLKGFAEKGVVGARAEIAKRKTAGTTEPIVEQEMSKSDIRSDENVVDISKVRDEKELEKEGKFIEDINNTNPHHLDFEQIAPIQSIGKGNFNLGERYWWENKYIKAGSHEVIVAGKEVDGKIPVYSNPKGKETFAIPEMIPKDQLQKITRNLSVVKPTKVVKELTSKDTSGSFSVANPVFSKATSEHSSSKKGKKEVVTLTPEQEKALVKKMTKALRGKGSKNTVIEKESIDAGANLTSIKERLLKDMLGYNPARTVTAELLQNALDATKENIGNITVDVVGNDLIMTDAGSGMTPEVAKNNLVRLGEHGTKGETDMGGFGLAKLPIMGWPDKFDIVTIADDVDGRYESHIWSTKEDYMNDHKVNFESEEVDSDPQTGLYAKDTGTKVTLTKDEFSRGSVRNIIANFANGLRTKHKITFINSEVGDPIVYEGTPLSEAKSKYEPIDLSFPGGTEVSIKFVDKEPYGWSEPYPITAHVYNKGLLLPDIPQYSSLSKFTLSRKPDFTIEVDFTRTPSASDTENYPFLVNRTRLNPYIENKIGAEIQHRVLDIESKITNLSQKSLKELFDNAPTVGGTKIIIPVDEVGIRENVAEVINTNKEAFQQLGALFSRYGRVLDIVPDTVPHTFAITTHSKVHGFRPKSGLLDKEYIVINPFSYLELSTTGSHKKFDDLFPNDLRKAATAIVDTLVHESAHINVPGHYADFVHEFHRINKEIGHKKLFSLEKEAQDVFTTFGEDITRATRNINELQREGTISDVFSDYTPEAQSQRVGEEGSEVYDRRTEEVGREVEERADAALQAMETKAEPEKKGTFLDILKNESGAVVASYPVGFYSKLQEVVEVKMSGKMEVDQLKKMLKNNGVSDAEINATLLGLEGKVTKQQVMEEIESNGIEFKDVVLGEIDKKYQDILNAEVSRANKFLQAQDTDIRKRASEIAAGDPHDLIAFASHVANNSSYMPVGTYKASEDFINIEDTELITHYEQYTEPGYVPGSYRELFVTVPKNSVSGIRDLTPFKDWTEAEIRQHYEDLFGSHNEAVHMHIDEIKSIIIAAESLERISPSDIAKEGEWYDGHSSYDNIENPIVRIRFDERKIDSKKVLFVEEIQGPSEANQSKMPDALQKRIYDIGVKKILSYAKENGFDSVAWTSGDMQADRYDLSKHIDSIKWNRLPSQGYKVDITAKDGNNSLGLYVGKDGIITDSHDSRLLGKPLENVVGKDIAKQIITEPLSFGELKGLNLKVGGEGLKQLYDKVLPSMFKKYGKNEIDKLSLDVEDDFKNWKAVYDPIEKEWVVENSDGKIMELVADKGQTAADAVDTALKSRGRYHKDGIVLSTPINSKTPSSFTMYSGINVFDTLDVLRGLKENIKEGIPYIEELGRKAYENGKRTWEDWSSEIKRVLGDLYDKFEDFMKAIYYTAERMWKDDRGVIGFDINGEKVVKPRIIRRSELSKLKRVISKHEKIREKIQDEVNELEGIGGKKSFERLKAIRLEKMEVRLAKLKQERAINRAEMWSKAFEMLKEKEYASHIAKLKTSINRLDKTIDRLKGLADKTKDRTDVKGPKVSLEDAEFITSMPDLKGKWLGRIFENPIYTMEEWGRTFNKLASGEAKDGVTKIKELFYYPLRDAAHRADQHFANIHAQIEARRKNLPKGASKRIMLYAYSKEKGGMDILKEMGYTEKDIPKLTEAEMSTLNWMYKGFEIFYDKINAARREAGMEQFGKVENYFTFGKDLSIAEILGFGVDDPRLMEFIHPKGTTFMSAKHRYGGMKRASLDAFNIFDMYMQTGTKHMYLSPEIARMRELLRKFDVENLNSDGSKYTTEWKASEQIPRAYSVLTDYLDFVAGKRKKLFPSSVEKGIQFLSTNITMATLSGNIRSAGIQPTAIHNTYVEIGPKYTAKGLEGLFTDMRYKAMQKSMVLFNREFDVSVKPTMSGAIGAIGKARESINKSWIGMRALKELDMQTATATWIGAYKKALEVNKMTEKEAVRYADDIVIKTQASAGRHDLAPIQRTAIGKFFTTFQTFVINNWNWLTKEVVGIGNESISNKKAIHKVVRYIVGAMLINTFYEDLLGVNSPLPAPIKAAHKAYVKAEEKNKKVRSEETMVNPYSRAAWSAGLEFLQLVPGLGNARFGSSFLGAPAEYLSDVSGKVAAESGIYTGYEKPWFEILGKTVGLPGTTQLSKTIRYFDKKEKEEEKERKGGGKLKGLEGMKGLDGLD